METMSPTVARSTTTLPPRQSDHFLGLGLGFKGPLTTVTDAETIPPTKQTDRKLPYWLVNVPPSHWPASCPSYLRDISQKNKDILSTPDHTYQRQGWDLVQELVRMSLPPSPPPAQPNPNRSLTHTHHCTSADTNRIDRFQRLPSDLRRYLEYKERIIAEYGSIMRFVVKERLQWGEGVQSDLQARGRPFEFDDDIRILYNDWPYGLEPDIVHLVVWTKFPLEEDPVVDDLTPRARREVEAFVRRTFCGRVPAEQVVWFRNWRSLKSVHAVEHFHVMLFRPDGAFVEEITRGDRPPHVVG
ncbi:GIG1 family protein [Aspergillus saccharolyticus JOP 1030-1]|uniref:N-acetylglucosamine-induced protein 1 n=1 Tax=Aspergillus saccharolyticus JOP 1030-1 TaxID=1450539 RepID=A0A319AUY9_9EURO|nr:hypothetical protein BP01DRAFT_8537 [Aspergillus saccharolyticus JOP 1030-1]PYH49872.1 hypothetical protein BP01DRAFT_8537 [Aspergillus saccharolyticus JOP 1030-1]